MNVCYSSFDRESYAKKPDPTKLFRVTEPEEQGIEILYAKKMEDEHEEYQFIQKEFEPPNQICTQVYQRIEFLQNVSKL